MNELTLSGKCVNEIEVIENEDGQKQAEIILAIPRNYKNEVGKYDIDFISVFSDRSRTTSMISSIEAGDDVALLCRIENTSYKSDMEIILVDMLGWAKKKVNSK